MQKKSIIVLTEKKTKISLFLFGGFIYFPYLCIVFFMVLDY